MRFCSLGCVFLHLIQGEWELNDHSYSLSLFYVLATVSMTSFNPETITPGVLVLFTHKVSWDSERLSDRVHNDPAGKSVKWDLNTQCSTIKRRAVNLTVRCLRVDGLCLYLTVLPTTWQKIKVLGLRWVDRWKDIQTDEHTNRRLIWVSQIQPQNWDNNKKGGKNLFFHPTYDQWVKLEMICQFNNPSLWFCCVSHYYYT